MTKEEMFKFIKKQNVALLASVDGDGFPNIKAINAPRKIDGNDIYFSTNTSSMRVSQFKNNPKACLYFYRRGKISYIGVMFVGTVQVLTDQEIKDELWHFGDTIFYKGGKTDPDYCILKFTADKCKFYNNLKTEWIEI